MSKDTLLGGQGPMGSGMDYSEHQNTLRAGAKRAFMVDAYNSVTLTNKLNDDKYADYLYLALCNNVWKKDGKEVTFSFREAGGVVADLRGKGEDYLNFYCYMDDDTVMIDGVPTPISEGYVSNEIRKDFASLGWFHEHRE